MGYKHIIRVLVSRKNCVSLAEVAGTYYGCRWRWYCCHIEIVSLLRNAIITPSVTYDTERIFLFLPALSEQSQPGRTPSTTAATTTKVYPKWHINVWMWDNVLTSLPLFFNFHHTISYKLHTLSRAHARQNVYFVCKKYDTKLLYRMCLYVNVYRFALIRSLRIFPSKYIKEELEEWASRKSGRDVTLCDDHF